MIPMDLMAIKMIMITIIHINNMLLWENQKENLLIKGEMKVQAMKKSIETHQDLMVVLLIWTPQAHIVDIANISKT